MKPHGTLDTADQLDARQFQIAVRKLADNLSYGTDRSPFLGSGLEFAQSRQYQYGDPIKLTKACKSLSILLDVILNAQSS